MKTLMWVTENRTYRMWVWHRNDEDPAAVLAEQILNDEVDLADNAELYDISWTNYEICQSEED